MRWRCRDPRCESCNEYKGIRYRDRVLNLIKTGIYINALELDENSANILCRSLGRNSYLRFPGQFHDTVFYSCESEFYAEGEESILEYDWSDLVRRKTNRNISGGLGKPSPKPDPKYTISTVDFIVESVDSIRDIVLAVAQRTLFVKPENVIEFMDIHNKYNDMLQYALVSNGVFVTKLNHNLHCDNLDLDFMDVE
jgi:hypothetical protein